MRRACSRLMVAASLLAAPLWAADSDAADEPMVEACSLDAARSGRPLPFGCANKLNLDAMVEDPADLAVGRVLPAPVGEHAVRAVGRSRDGTVAPLPTASSMEAPDASGAH